MAIETTTFADITPGNAIQPGDKLVGVRDGLDTLLDAPNSGSSSVYIYQPVNAATITVLPACTYANGSLGVGATLTGNSNGALAAIDGVTLTQGQSVLVQN